MPSNAASNTRSAFAHVSARQVLDRRPVEHLPFRGEARAVARTVPALLAVVPPQHTFHMRADRGNGVQLARLASRDADRPVVGPNDGSVRGSKGRLLARQQRARPVGRKMRADLGVVRQEGLR